MSEYSIPPQRELPAARLAARKCHLLTEIEAGLPRAFPLRAGLAAAAVAAAAVAVLLVAPRGGAPSLTDRALAAVGDEPVLHVVTEQTSGLPGAYHPVSIATGQPVAVTMHTEIWFDEERQAEKTVSTLDGMTFQTLVESPAGWFSDEGVVYTCAWIAAHPIEATKARVSCNENMENGTTPHTIPESPPAPLDPALSGFVDRYQSALESGEATQTGTGQVDGRDVIWLRIARPTEDVAIDAETYQPVLVQQGSESFRVLRIETEPYDPSLFEQPEPHPKPTIGEVVGSEPIAASQAPRLLDGSAFWLGESWNGYRLDEVAEQELTTGYGALSGREPVHSQGVQFEYKNAAGETLTIREATTCQMAYGWSCERLPVPPAGTMAERLPVGGTLVHHGVYVSIWFPPASVDLLEVARALTAVPTTS